MMCVTRAANPLSFLYQLDDRSRRVTLLGLLVTAFVLRLAVALILPLDYRLQKDAVEYVSVADNLLSHGVFGSEEGVPYAKIPPGYPLFLAGIFALSGRSLLAVRAAQVVLGTITVWLTYLAGQRTFSHEVGLVAALICALCPPFVVYVAPYWTEVLYTALALIFILYFVRLLRNPSVGDVSLAGIGFGLSVLVKESLIAFPVALPVSFWWARFDLRQALKYLVVFAVVALLMLSPWLARNYLTFGSPFYTSRTAYIQYELTGTGYLSPHFEDEAEDRESPVPESDDLYDYYQQYGRTSDLWNVDFLLHEPATYLRYIINRLIEFWLHPNGLHSLPPHFALRAGYTAAHVGVLGLAVWQMAVRLRGRDAATGGLVLILLYLTGIGVFLRRPNPRYNLPFLPIVFIFTARGILEVADRLSGRNPHKEA
jgi:4-amino-4-deoxy-L-arabinose transferase-like glycosyltransferase